jgi:hypothetical protein
VEISLAYSARPGAFAESARNSSINRAERKLVKTNLPGIGADRFAPFGYGEWRGDGTEGGPEIRWKAGEGQASERQEERRLADVPFERGCSDGGYQIGESYS